jgi:hypothetical protein
MQGDRLYLVSAQRNHSQEDQSLRSRIPQPCLHTLYNEAALKLSDGAGLFLFQLTPPVPSSVWGGGGGGGGATGLYSGAGLAGLLTGLACCFFGFLFSRPRLSRLPMTCSSLPAS